MFLNACILLYVCSHVNRPTSLTWNIEDSNKCPYCQEIDILSHYFVECESMRGFWNSLKAMFLCTFEFCINFTVLNILFGTPYYGKNRDIDILNFVILIAKSYIYNSMRDEPNLSAFMYKTAS